MLATVAVEVVVAMARSYTEIEIELGSSRLFLHSPVRILCESATVSVLFFCFDVAVELVMTFHLSVEAVALHLIALQLPAINGCFSKTNFLNQIESNVPFERACSVLDACETYHHKMHKKTADCIVRISLSPTSSHTIRT